MPSFSSTNINYTNVKNTQVLAMGTDKFERKPLELIPELLEYLRSLWSARTLKDENFTIKNLQTELETEKYGIVHLGTHAKFFATRPNESYIQFWQEEKLGLDEIGKLSWNKSPVNLLVLGACETALGEEDAELGFAGSAPHAGVKAVLGSWWEVQHIATTELMKEFYQQLQTASSKADALRKAQLALSKEPERSHPYFWAGFTMVGNPW